MSSSILSPSSTDVGEATRLATGLGTARLPAGMHSGACWKLGPTAGGHTANGEAANGDAANGGVAAAFWAAA